MTFEFWVGTYTHKGSANGEGIYRAAVDADGTLHVPVLTARWPNPSYLAQNPAADRVYAVSEVSSDMGASVAEFEMQGGHLAFLSRTAVSDSLPCHLAVSPDGSLLACSHYGSGCIQVFRCTGDGLSPVWEDRPVGRGTHPIRQTESHVHASTFLSGGAELAVADLGLDTVTIYETELGVGANLNTDASFVEGRQTVHLPPGCGVRHLVASRDNDRIFALGELEETVFLLTRAAKGAWELSDSCVAVPRPKGGDGSGAAIRLSPDERFIYVSSRTTNEIKVIATGEDGRSMRRLSSISTCGLCPRDFALSPDGSVVVVANQKSGTLQSYLRDNASGALISTSSMVEMPAPVCVFF